MGLSLQSVLPLLLLLFCAVPRSHGTALTPPWIDRQPHGFHPEDHALVGVNDVVNDDVAYRWKKAWQAATGGCSGLDGGNAVDLSLLRGGGRRTPPVRKRGPIDTIKATSAYWKKTFKSTTLALKRPFQSFGRKPQFLKSKTEKRQEEFTQKVRTTPIRHVSAPNSTLIPHEVLEIAAKRTGVIGNPLRPAAVQDLARALQQWYTRKGYVLSSVTGATLQVDTQTAELAVEEPVSSDIPISLVYCKEMVVDPDDGSLMTYRQYKTKHARRKSFGYDRISKTDLNTTYVPSTDGGRTNPRSIAKALKLQPKSPFCWKAPRWDAIVQSGIFRRVLNTSPRRMPDGTVQLQVFVEENPTRHLEYGLSKSLYTGSWEGEIDFEHGNLLGGGESLGLTVRRGTHDAEPSVRLCFTDNKFGMEWIW